MNRVIIIEEDLLDILQVQLTILKKFWECEGADEIFLETHPKGVHLNPSIIREYLKSIPNLEGALLIGELPVARIGTPDNWYASDYYFMELQGNWVVNADNFVSCNNYLPPSIFVGRIVIGEDTGGVLVTERPSIDQFYVRYFTKLLDYRLNSSFISIRRNGEEYDKYRFSDTARNNYKAVLVNNWGGDTQTIAEWLTHLYPQENIRVFADVNKDEYWAILEAEPFDFIAFRSHSSGMSHTLEDSTNWNGQDYLLVDSNINFYELTACGTGALVVDFPIDPSDPASPNRLRLTYDLLAWNILFAEKGGVIVLAPSISGCMNHTVKFYDYLVEGGTFGRAFRLWAEYIHSFAANPNGWAFNLFFGDPFIHFDIPDCKCMAYTSLVSSAHEYKLKELRLWRDIIFKRNSLGRSFINNYYRISRPISKLVIKFRYFKILSRRTLILILTCLKQTKWNRVVEYNLKISVPKAPKKISLSVLECKYCAKRS